MPRLNLNTVDLEKCDQYPNRGKIERGYKNVPKINGMSCYKFATRILENNIGKSFDGAFSYYSRKAGNIPKRRYVFMRNLEGRYPYYMIDSDGNIQENSKLFFRRERKPIVILSDDYSETWLVKRKYSDKYGTKTFRYTPNKYIQILDNLVGSKPISTTGFIRKFESRNDRRYQRYHQEREQAQKKKEKLEKQARLQKQYSFLTKSEIELKESKKEDLIKLYTKGFDSESFRGTHYHGRKNKKKK